MKLLLFPALAMLFFSACKKDEKKSETCLTGKIRFVNNDSFPYRIYLDGDYKAIVTPGSFKEYDAPKGTHNVKAEQDGGGGYKEGVYTLMGCDSQRFEF